MDTLVSSAPFALNRGGVLICTSREAGKEKGTEPFQVLLVGRWTNTDLVRLNSFRAVIPVFVAAGS